MSFAEHCNAIFDKVVADYHLTDNVDTPIQNPYKREKLFNIVGRLKKFV
ncbi:MAG: hypothetical protein UDP20_03250 [Prevotella sp.]|nr:hypothetical protein [Prevotella sp.]